jgi:1,4-alpha-glucan branching enzyme
VGDFNDWIPQIMAKDASGMWTIALKIVPGGYAYNFIIDGRPVRDFNNPRTKDTGRGFVSSFLEVKPFDPDDK